MRHAKPVRLQTAPTGPDKSGFAIKFLLTKMLDVGEEAARAEYIIEAGDLAGG